MKNNVACDINMGICGTNQGGIEEINIESPIRKLDFYYITDPLCSYCWAFEPTLKKLEALYGQYFNFTIIMGGLLEDWNGFSDPDNGIQSPSDVASHWHELGELYRMPISGKIWLTNPVKSSYPACIVYKLIAQKDPMKAKQFLRNVREAVMVWNRDIANDDILISLVNELGFSGEQIVEASHTAQGKALLEEDMRLAEQLGVDGFPTVIIVNHKQNGMKVAGLKDFETYEGILSKLTEKTVEFKRHQPPLLQEWLQDVGRLYAREIEIMYDLSQNELVPFIKNELQNIRYRVDEAHNEFYLELDFE